MLSDGLEVYIPEASLACGWWTNESISLLVLSLVGRSAVHAKKNLLGKAVEGSLASPILTVRKRGGFRVGNQLG